MITKKTTDIMPTKVEHKLRISRSRYIELPADDKMKKAEKNKESCKKIRSHVMREFTTLQPKVDPGNASQSCLKENVRQF